MKSYYYKKRILFKIFVIFWFLFSPLKTVANQNFDVPQAVQQASHSIWRLKSGKFSGSGVSLGLRLIATNFHVVEGWLRSGELLEISLIQNGEESSLKITGIRYLSVALDIALLETDQDVLSYLNLQEVPAHSADKLFVLGYPGEDLRFIRKIGPLQFFQDVQYFFVNQEDLFGVSGGPVVDLRGKVVGINRAGINNHFESVSAIQLQRALNDELGVSCRGVNAKNCREEAISYIHNQGLEGDTLAQYRLGVMYGKGEYDVEQDLGKAFYWLEQAAEQGNAPAQHQLGIMYAKGFGVEQDLEIAFYWYEQAAEQGHVLAQYQLGIMYAKGFGVEQDLEIAFYWYEQVAEQGYVPAQLKLSVMYEEGFGVERDFIKAIGWVLKMIRN